MAAILFYPPFWVAAGEAATAAAPWIAGALGIGITAKVITDNMSTAEDKAQALDQSGTAADTCATGNCPPPNGGCKFDNYNKLDCEGGQKKHHIIADYVIRAGKRLDVNMRLPNTPSLNDGPVFVSVIRNILAFTDKWTRRSLISALRQHSVR